MANNKHLDIFVVSNVDGDTLGFITQRQVDRLFAENRIEIDSDGLYGVYSDIEGSYLTLKRESHLEYFEPSDVSSEPTKRDIYIKTIEKLFPSDDKNSEVGSIGKNLLLKTMESVSFNWRHLPTKVLKRYSMLCEKEASE